MLRGLWLGLRLRRPLVHAAAFLAALTICLLISAVPIPAAAPDPFSGHPEHLAYGYLYFPLAILPVIAFLTQSPLDWAEQGAGPRARLVDTTVLVAATLAAAAGAVATALVAGDPGGWIVALTNLVGVLTLLVIALRVLNAQWAWIPAFAYLAAGLTLPTLPLLVLNREESASRLLTGVVLLGTVIALRHQGVLRARLREGVDPRPRMRPHRPTAPPSGLRPGR